jgi:hypothetical protein
MENFSQNTKPHWYKTTPPTRRGDRIMEKYYFARNFLSSVIAKKLDFYLNFIYVMAISI